MSATRTTYPAAIKWLHWITALCVAVLVPVGIIMHNLESGPTQDTLYFYHKSFGILVLALTLARLAIGLILGAPAPAAALTPFERIASLIAHRLLYVLLIVMPILGSDDEFVDPDRYRAPERQLHAQFGQGRGRCL